jgi:hypothetical protein
VNLNYSDIKLNFTIKIISLAWSAEDVVSARILVVALDASREISTSYLIFCFDWLDFKLDDGSLWPRASHVLPIPLEATFCQLFPRNLPYP